MPSPGRNGILSLGAYSSSVHPACRVDWASSFTPHLISSPLSFLAREFLTTFHRTTNLSCRRVIMTLKVSFLLGFINGLTLLAMASPPYPLMITANMTHNWSGRTQAHPGISAASMGLLWWRWLKVNWWIRRETRSRIPCSWTLVYDRWHLWVPGKENIIVILGQRKIFLNKLQKAFIF